MRSRPAPAAPKFAAAIEGSLNHLTAKITAIYGEQRVTLAADAGQGTLRRHEPAESSALERLRRAGFVGPGADGVLVLKGEPRILAFFATELPRLQRDWTVTIGERFEHVTRDVERITPRFEIKSSGTQWFDLQVELATPGGELFRAEIQRLLNSGPNSIRTKAARSPSSTPRCSTTFASAPRLRSQQRQPGSYRTDSATPPTRRRR